MSEIPVILAIMGSVAVLGPAALAAGSLVHRLVGMLP
jgi:hypothetical protein